MGWASVQVTNDVTAAGNDIGPAVPGAAGGGGDQGWPAIAMGLVAHVPAVLLAVAGLLLMSRFIRAMTAGMAGRFPVMLGLPEIMVVPAGLTPMAVLMGLMPIGIIVRCPAVPVAVLAMDPAVGSLLVVARSMTIVDPVLTGAAVVGPVIAGGATGPAIPIAQTSAAGTIAAMRRVVVVDLAADPLGSGSGGRSSKHPQRRQQHCENANLREFHHSELLSLHFRKLFASAIGI
jgi:hypothetical protein